MSSRGIGLTVSEGIASRSRDAVERILAIDPTAPTNPSQLARWLVLAHPDDVTRDDIEREVAKQERRIASHHRIEGMVFPIYVEPTDDGRAQGEPRIKGVADGALFNGIYLAGLVAKSRVTNDPAALRDIAESVDAIHKLAHVTETPGALARFALPLERAITSRVAQGPDRAGDARISNRHIYYRDPAHVRPDYAHLTSVVAGRDGLAPIRRSPVGRFLTGQPHHDDQFFCTRTSRDQLPGVVFGLAFTMKAFEDECFPKDGADRELWISIRRTLSVTTAALYRHLRTHEWVLVDPFTGSRAGASHVSGLLRTALDLLFRRALLNQWTDPSWRDDSDPSLHEQLDWYRRDTRGSCLPGQTAGSSLWRRAMWRLPARYYAWHLRLLRLVSVLVLDDLHPASLANPPAGWPVQALTRSATTERNRRWLRVFDTAFWRRRGTYSDPWATYLFNRTRADVLLRHVEDVTRLRSVEPDLDIYSVSRADFDRLARATSVHAPAALRRVLFDGHAAIGCELPRAHFHFRSLALKPWRTHSAPWAKLNRFQRGSLQTHRPAPVHPPHLMRHTNNWLFEKDPTAAPSAAEDPIGRAERMLIDLPVLYWMIVEDGQWRSRWASFASSEFTPPGEVLELCAPRIAERRAGGYWPNVTQEMLLRAALMDGTDAVEAWRAVRPRLSVEDVDPVSRRLFPLLGANLRRLRIDDPLAARVGSIRRTTATKNRRLFDAGRRFLAVLADAGIATLVLKGGALAGPRYGDIGMRPMSDLDILVPTAHAGAAVEALRAAGWSAHTPVTTEFIRMLHAVKLREGASSVTCDLHWHVYWECCGPGADEDLWAASQPLDFEGESTRTLGPADQLLHLCVHGSHGGPAAPSCSGSPMRCWCSARGESIGRGWSRRRDDVASSSAPARCSGISSRRSGRPFPRRCSPSWRRCG